jgi:predicted dehydrogenase
VKKLRLAVVGAGRLGGFHAQKLAALSSVELVAVADPLAASRDALAALCHTRAVADAAELAGQVDAVVIAAPTCRHHALGMDFLRQGVHVLLEKPLAATADQSDALVEAARRAGVVLQVGHVERFNPAFTAFCTPHAPREGLRQAEHEGLRHVEHEGLRHAERDEYEYEYDYEYKYIEAVRSSPFSFRSTDVGVVLDLMIHDLDLVLWLVRSRVRRIDALGVSVLGGHEDVANVRLEFQSGCVASLSASRVSYDAVRRMQVWSARAMATIDFSARTTTTIRPSRTLLGRQFDVESLSSEQVEHYKTHLLEEHLPRQTQQFPAVDALALELDDFLDSIRNERPPRVTGEHGRDAVALAEEILLEIDRHVWDATSDGPVGPHALPRPRTIPAPHFRVAPATRKEAG